MISNAQNAAIHQRGRKLYAGSAELLVHGFTDSYLDSITQDELVAREAAWLHHNVERVQRAAQAELDWRREAGVSFGWTSR